MKKMKKIMCAVLALVLMLSVLCACGKKDVAVVTEAPATAETEAVVPAETEAPEAAEVAEAESGFYQIGDKIEDFTVTTYDGKEVSLYKVLEEKDMVLVNIWASWCGPCKSLSPVLDELAKEYSGKLDIYKVNVDNEQELASFFRIRSVPTLLFVPMEGDPQINAGAPSKADLKRFLDSFIG